MKINEVYNLIESIKKGTIHSITFKKEQDNLKKITTERVRIGIEYQNLKENQGKVFTNELPWGKYMNNYYGYLIEHTNKKGEYNIYLRFYVFNQESAKSKYFENDCEITKEEAIEKGWKATKQKSDNSCRTINIENIIAFN